MHADAFTEEFLDHGHEWIVRGEGQVPVRVICSLQASSQRRYVERLWCLDALIGDFLLPEEVRFDGLRDAVGG